MRDVDAEREQALASRQVQAARAQDAGEAAARRVAAAGGGLRLQRRAAERARAAEHERAVRGR